MTFTRGRPLRRYRTGWLVVLLGSVVSLVLSAVPAAAIPTVPAPTVPAAPGVSSEPAASDDVSQPPVDVESKPCLAVRNPEVYEWMQEEVSPETMEVIDSGEQCFQPANTDAQATDAQAGSADAQAADAEGEAAEGEAAGPGPGTPITLEQQMAYGMEGCRVVAGFNDRCPDLVSEKEPLSPSSTRGAGPQANHWVASPEGDVLYGVGMQWEAGLEVLGLSSVWVPVVMAVRAADGEFLWKKSLGMPLEQVNAPVSPQMKTIPLNIAVSPDGNRLFVHGFRCCFEDWLRDAWIAAVDTSTGVTEWAQLVIPAMMQQSMMEQSQPGVTAATASMLWPFGLVVSPDGKRVFQAVNAWYLTPGVGGYSEGWNLAWDASSGATEWANILDNPQMGHSTARSALVVSRDGALLYSQATIGGSSHNIVTIARDTSTGEEVWKQQYTYKNYSGPQHRPDGLMLSPDGDTVYLRGVAWEFFGPSRYVVVAYDAVTGSQRWATEIKPLGECSDVVLWRLSGYGGRGEQGFSPSGDLLYVGTWFYSWGDCSPTKDRMGSVVMAVRTGTGEVAWRTAQHDVPISMGVFFTQVAAGPGPGGGDEGSHVFVTSVRHSGAWGFGQFYVSVLSIDGMTGEQLWHARYLDTYNDGQSGVEPSWDPAVSRDGTQLLVPVFQNKPGLVHPFTGHNRVLRYDVRR